MYPFGDQRIVIVGREGRPLRFVTYMDINIRVFKFNKTWFNTKSLKELLKL